MSAYEDMVTTAKAKSDEDVLRYVLDSLPIIATRMAWPPLSWLAGVSGDSAGRPMSCSRC